MEDETRAALLRFFSPGWRDHELSEVNPKDPDVERLCVAGFCGIGHVTAGHGMGERNLLLLTVAGFDARDSLDAEARRAVASPETSCD